MRATLNKRLAVPSPKWQKRSVFRAGIQICHNLRETIAVSGKDLMALVVGFDLVAAEDQAGWIIFQLADGTF